MSGTKLETAVSLPSGFKFRELSSLTAFKKMSRRPPAWGPLADFRGTTTDPAEGTTLARMASIPHGTTIVAQGTSSTLSGKPTIPAVDITPFLTLPPNTKIAFASRTAATKNTPRIPQDLTSLIAAGTITQAMLTDPNTVLRNHIASQKIISTTEISISTSPATALFGGGTDNIAFLLGNAAATAPNAQTLKMTATFWIETVEHVIHVPIFKPGQPPLTVRAETGDAGQPVPQFLVDPPIEITTPRSITVNADPIFAAGFLELQQPHLAARLRGHAGACSRHPASASVWN
jgi:hypothetical protein